MTGLQGSVLACGLKVGGAGPVLPLEVSVGRDRLEGQLGSPWGRLEVRSQHGYAGSALASMDANGFEVSQGGQSWMVVETLNAGRVLIGPSADPRQPGPFHHPRRRRHSSQPTSASRRGNRRTRSNSFGRPNPNSLETSVKQPSGAPGISRHS